MTVEDVWSSRAVWARLVRVALTPVSWLYEAVIGVRNFAYDRGWLGTIPSSVPVISVGNVSVGGTGKTPITSFFAELLQQRGYHPAIVMRGYGDDETRVHGIITPTIPVYANPDRAQGISDAASDGATAGVLDDGFQHRRAGRKVDVVLISADQWAFSQQILPAGPLREPLRSIRRADLVIVTRKAVTDDYANGVRAAVRSIAAHVPTSIVHLCANQLVSLENKAALPLSSLSGASVLAIAGVGDPGSFFAQLRGLGANVTEQRFPDHYAYTEKDVAILAEKGVNHKYIVTTLKDTVKLATFWTPKDGDLWYVSQTVEVDDGKSFIDTLMANFFPLR